MYSIRPSLFVILFVLLACLFALSGCDKEDGVADGEDYVTICSDGHCRKVKVQHATTATTDITAETLKQRVDNAEAAKDLQVQIKDINKKVADDSGDVTISKTKDGVLIQYFHIDKDGRMTEYSPGIKPAEPEKREIKKEDLNVKEHIPLKYDTKAKVVEEPKSSPVPDVSVSALVRIGEFYTNPTTGQKTLIVYEGEPKPPAGVPYVRKTRDGKFINDEIWPTSTSLEHTVSSPQKGEFIEVNGCKTCWRIKE